MAPKLTHYDAFTRFHPITNFLFFLTVILLTVFFNHPIFLLISYLFAALYIIVVHNKSSFKLLGSTAILLMAVAAINPLFNIYGETVLFTPFEGRPYTLEALLYGIALGFIFVSVILWLYSFNQVITSDKITYLFGKLAPAISLVFTLTVRLVPSFQRKAKQIAEARASIGLSHHNGSNKQKINNGLQTLSALVSWSFEGAAVTSDSMESRGYGAAERSTFSIFKLDMRDVALIVFILFAFVVVLVCSLSTGITNTTYTPVLYIAPITTTLGALAVLAFLALVSIPVFINVFEAAVWHYLISKI